MAATIVACLVYKVWVVWIKGYRIWGGTLQEIRGVRRVLIYQSPIIAYS